ncbi:hypothetical protein IG631_15155 [Alternaria alternata]|nr:hypothetical protein IG631_15155 [Alternaria alternata]
MWGALPCWPSRAPSSNLGTFKRSDDGAAAKALSSRASGPDEAAISHSHFADPASAQCNTSATP